MVKKRNGRNDSRSTCYLRCVEVEVEVEVEKEEEEDEDEEKEKKERKISTTCFLRWRNRREGHVEMYALYAPYEEQRRPSSVFDSFHPAYMFLSYVTIKTSGDIRRYRFLREQG